MSTSFALALTDTRNSATRAGVLQNIAHGLIALDRAIRMLQRFSQAPHLLVAGKALPVANVIIRRRGRRLDGRERVGIAWHGSSYHE